MTNTWSRGNVKRVCDDYCVAFRDGDGWVFCQCGQQHWGLHGAAGLLLIRRDRPTPEVLLQLRAAWVHGGGTWALPGGALDSHEDSIEAAAREAHEEAGIDPGAMEFKAIFSADHGAWKYDTVIAHSYSDAGAFAANAETEALHWVAINDIDSYDLHPGLKSAWPELRKTVEQTLVD